MKSVMKSVMKKIKKGQAGYIDYMKVRAILRSLLLYAISFGIFAAGWIYTGKRENIMTVVAVLGILPASRALVNAIMFNRFCSAPADFVRKVKTFAKENNLQGLRVFFDSVITIEHGGSALIRSFVFVNNKLLGIMEKKAGKRAVKVSDVKSHIQLMFKNNGLKLAEVRVMDSEEAFLREVKVELGRENEFSEDFCREVMALVGAISL